MDFTRRNRQENTIAGCPENSRQTLVSFTVAKSLPESIKEAIRNLHEGDRDITKAQQSIIELVAHDVVRRIDFCEEVETQNRSTQSCLTLILHVPRDIDPAEGTVSMTASYDPGKRGQEHRHKAYRSLYSKTENFLDACDFKRRSQAQMKIDGVIDDIKRLVSKIVPGSKFYISVDGPTRENGIYRACLWWKGETVVYLAESTDTSGPLQVLNDMANDLQMKQKDVKQTEKLRRLWEARSQGGSVYPCMADIFDGMDGGSCARLKGRKCNEVSLETISISGNAS